MELQSLGESLKQIARELEGQGQRSETRTAEMQQTLAELERQLNTNLLTVQEAQQQTQALHEKVLLSERLQNDLQAKYRQIDRNFEKYVFRTRAQAIVPFFYALGAVVLGEGDYADKALFALAGYGTGALIENTGFGVSRGVTFLRYSFSF